MTALILNMAGVVAASVALGVISSVRLIPPHKATQTFWSLLVLSWILIAASLIV